MRRSASLSSLVLQTVARSPGSFPRFFFPLLRRFSRGPPGARRLSGRIKTHRVVPSARRTCRVVDRVPRFLRHDTNPLVVGKKKKRRNIQRPYRSLWSTLGERGKGGTAPTGDCAKSRLASRMKNTQHNGLETEDCGLKIGFRRIDQLRSCSSWFQSAIFSIQSVA